MTTHKSYKEETLKEILVEQGKQVTVVFPSTFPSHLIEEWKKDNTLLRPGCGCTSYSVQEEREQITFVVNAPSFAQDLNEPYLKEVMPKFYGSERIQWDIKFYVNPKK